MPNAALVWFFYGRPVRLQQHELSRANPILRSNVRSGASSNTGLCTPRLMNEGAHSGEPCLVLVQRSPRFTKISELFRNRFTTSRATRPKLLARIPEHEAGAIVLPGFTSAAVPTGAIHSECSFSNQQHLIHSQGARVMRKEDNSTNPGTRFSEVWTNAQISRSVVVGALFRNVWRRLFAISPVSNSPKPTSRRRRGIRFFLRKHF